MPRPFDSEPSVCLTVSENDWQEDYGQVIARLYFQGPMMRFRVLNVPESPEVNSSLAVVSHQALREYQSRGQDSLHVGKFTCAAQSWDGSPPDTFGL